jgi:hypothetical protein
MNENLLLAMLPRKHIQKLAARRILKAHNVKTKNGRLFKLPHINLNASSHIDLIDWQ